jgi:hypothetical protein
MIESSKLLRVYDKGQLIQEFKIDTNDKGLKPAHPEHEELNRKYKDKKEAVKSNLLNIFLITFGVDGAIYAKRLKDSVGANLYWLLKEIMTYIEIYNKETVLEAIKESIVIGAYHKNSLKRLLSNKPHEYCYRTYEPASDVKQSKYK